MAANAIPTAAAATAVTATTATASTAVTATTTTIAATAAAAAGAAFWRRRKCDELIHATATVYKRLACSSCARPYDATTSNGTPFYDAGLFNPPFPGAECSLAVARGRPISKGLRFLTCTRGKVRAVLLLLTGWEEHVELARM